MSAYCEHGDCRQCFMKNRNAVQVQDKHYTGKGFMMKKTWDESTGKICSLNMDGMLAVLTKAGTDGEDLGGHGAKECIAQLPLTDQEKTFYSFLEFTVRKAGRRMLEAHLTAENIHRKDGIANFVTAYDVEIQKFLITELKMALPEALFFGEEETEGNQHRCFEKGYTFFIDPIDGTTNFLFGYHHSCVSVGLALDGRMIAGFVYNPYVNDMYMAIRGAGSFLNAHRLQMENRQISEGIVAFGCARYNESDTDLLFEVVKELYLLSLSVRNGGSAALDLCRVASCANAAFLELKLQPYDYAAASVIIEEAGGCITQADGSEILLNAPCSIAAGSKRAAETVRSVIQKRRTQE